MKKIFLIILVLSVGRLFGQSIVPRTNPSFTVSDARFQAQLNAFIPRYIDTTAANVQKGIDSCGAIIFTYSANAYWYRACSPKHWVLVGAPTSFNFISDSTLTICFGNGTFCVTIQLINFDSTVVNIVNNVIDTSSIVNNITNIYNNSITNIFLNGDSTCIIRQTGGGINVDTTCFPFTICSFGAINACTLYACSCPDSLGNTTCDTVTVTCLPLYIKLNWVGEPSVGLTEFGAKSPTASPGYLLSHDTYTSTGGLKMTWQGYKVYDANHTFEQQQSFQNSTGIINFRSYGNPIINGPFVWNNVKLWVNYTDSLYKASPHINGYMGQGRNGYLFGVNGTGFGSYGWKQDDTLSKTAYLFFNTTDTTNSESFSIVGVPKVHSPGANIMGGTGSLSDYRIITGYDNGKVQYPYYTPEGNFVVSDTSANKPAVFDGSGNIYRLDHWPSGASVNIYNSDGTITGNRLVDGNGKVLTIDSVADYEMSTRVSSNKNSTFSFQPPNVIIRSLIGNGSSGLSEMETIAGDPFSDGTTLGISLRADNGSIDNRFNLSERYIKLLTDSLKLPRYGAGTLTTDASGNVTAISDVRMKDVQGNYRSGIKEIMNITPIVYKWKKKSGMETEHNYIGFSAQNIKYILGDDAVGIDRNGYLSIQDRAIMGAMVNAMKQMERQIIDLQKEVIKLKSKK